ncbi:MULTISPECIES: CD3324 family protein [Clostridiaceae]|uniref:CD3324 family protein n=1 Tax=Clostridiaceae TaxID=31979 RepID=UPI0005555335|nr:MULTISPECIES: CD3324 family protein [Clostridiaceae]
MKYVKAHNVLPEEIIELVQEYIDGEYLYIPRKSENQKSWGEKNGTRNSLKRRNNEIFKKYARGYKVSKLSEEYFLSEQSIRKIISKERKLCS